MTDRMLAATLVEPRRFELREYGVPELTVSNGHRCGVCGSDVRGWGLHGPRRAHPGPREPRPRCGAGSRGTSALWREGGRPRGPGGVSPCGVCDVCRAGDYRFCPQTDIGLAGERLWYGSVAASRSPALWGGYSQYLYLHPSAVMHRVPDHVPASEVALFLPLANGFE